jgi:8-oxo-dGTP diphosphatase
MTEKVTTLLFFVRNDEILLAMKKRGFGANRYNGVGGKLDPGETVEQTLIRESEEEIGVTPIHFWKVAEHDFIQEDSDSPWRMYVHVYFCDQWQGEPIETEEMAPEWFNVKDIPYDKMWQDDEHWLPQVLSGRQVYGQFSFDKADTMLTKNVEIVNELPGRIPIAQIGEIA